MLIYQLLKRQLAHSFVVVVCGSCLAVASFYLLLPDDLRGAAATAPPGGAGSMRRSKYEIYDIEETARSRSGRGADYDFEDVSERESDEEMDITYRSPLPNGPASATPLVRGAQPKKNHRHTASIASLIRAEERGEEGWSPIGGSFSIPPTPTQR